MLKPLLILTNLQCGNQKDCPMGVLNLYPMSNNGLNPEINFINNAKIQLKLYGHCLKQDKATFTPKY